MTDQVLTIVLKGDGTQLTGTVNAGGAALKQLGQHADDAGKKAEGAGEKFRAAGDTIKDTLKDVAAAVGLAFSVDKMVEFVHSAIESADQINNMSQSVGIGTQTLQGMSYAAGLTGASMQTLTESIARMERASLEARDGNAQSTEAFRALGISIQDIRKLSPDELMKRVTTSLAGMADGSTKTAIAMQLLGRGAAENIPFINKLGSEFDAMMAKAKAIGVIMSGADLQALIAYKEQTNELGQEVKGLGNQFAVALLPALTSVVGQIQRAAESGELAAELKDLAAVAKVVADNIDAIVTVAKILAEIKLASWAADAALAVRDLGFAADGSKTKLLSINGALGVVGAAIAGWNIGKYLSDNFVEAQNAGARFVQATLIEWELIKAGAQTAWIGVKIGFVEAIGVMKSTLADFLTLAASSFDKLSGVGLISDALGGPSFRSEVEKLTVDLRAASPAIDGYKTELAGVGAQLAKNINQISSTVNAQVAFNDAQAKSKEAVAQASAGQAQLNDIVARTAATFSTAQKGTQSYANLIDHLHQGEELLRDAGAKLIAQGADAATVNKLVSTSVQQLDTAFENATKAQGTYNTQVDAGIAKANAQAEALRSLRAIQDDIAAQFQGPYEKALADYEKRVDAINDAVEKYLEKGVPLSALEEQQQKDLDAASAAYNRNLDQIEREHDLLSRQKLDMEAAQKLWGVLPNQIDAARAAQKLYDDQLAKGEDLEGQSYDTRQELIDALHKEIPVWQANQQAINDNRAAMDAANTAVKDYVNDYVQAGQSVAQEFGKMFTGQVKSWKQFASDIGNIVRTMVANIIAQIIQLEFINPILNRMFGGILNLATAQTVGGTAGGQQSGLAGLLGGGGAGGGGLFGNFGNLGNLIGSPTPNGGGLMGWLFGGAATADLGGAGVLAGEGAFYGATAEGTLGASGGYLGYLGNLGDYGAAAGPGAAGGSFLGSAIPIASGVLAGVGEYNAAGGGLAGAAGGLAYGVGTASLATAATSSAGLMAGLSAIPVVGWIAIAAMVLNMVTGGGLFGTAATKPVGGNITEAIGPNGANVSGEFTYKGKKPLFGGSYYEEHKLPIDQQTQDQATAFYTALLSGRDAFAAQFNVQMGDIVGGTFHQTLDKTGKVTSTDDTVLGVKYNNETQQQFAERLQADNYLAVLDKIGFGASEFVKGLQGDADKLFAAVQDLAQTAQAAQTDINRHMGLLGSDGTLADVLNEVVKLNVSGEALSATYARLEQETQTVKATIEGLGVKFTLTGTDLVEFADQLTAAAGGLQNLQAEWQGYYNYYYSASERAARAFDAQHKQIMADYAAVGETAGKTAAELRADFEAYLAGAPTAEGVQAWLKLLSEFASASTNFDSFMQPFRAMDTTGTSFEQTMQGLNAQLQQNITTANQLAQAQGLQGASAQDIAQIIEYSAKQGAAAFQQLWQSAQQLSQQLYGSGYVDELKQKLHDEVANTGVLDYGLMAQIAQAQSYQQQQEAGQRYLQATQLAGMVADIMATQGGDLKDILMKLGIPLDAFSSDLQLQGQSLDDYIGKLEDQAKINLNIQANTGSAVNLLTDILDVLQGLPLQFTAGSAFVPLDSNGTLTPGTGGIKPGGTIVPGPKSATFISSPGTRQSTVPSADSTIVVKTIKKIGDAQIGQAKVFTAEVSAMRLTMERRGLRGTSARR